MVNSKIFKAYDIRGIYPEELNESSAYDIGRAFAVWLEQKSGRSDFAVVVGRDARLSSPELTRSFIRGVADQGLDVWDIGLVSVDMVYFASAHWHLPAAMVTASHNPKQWNGFKLMAGDIDLLGGDSGLEEIKNLILKKNWPEATVGSGVPEGNALPDRGRIAEKSILEDFTRHVLSFADIETLRPMRIAVDTGSGAVGPTLKMILDKLPLEYKALYFDPDGDFPYHEPNPILDNNLQDLIGVIRVGHYHFGCAFDGDGDRVIFVDENGDALPASVAGSLMVRHFLSKSHGDSIVHASTVSRIVPEMAQALGGRAFRERVGHTFISRKLKEVGGILGVESSGHYFFRKNFYADSAIISFLVMLEILSAQKKSLSVLARDISKYVSTPEINFRVSDPTDTIKNLAAKFEGYDVDWLDGLTVRTEDFWLNLRPSNTEPLLRLNIEAKDELILTRVRKDIIELIEKYT